MQINSTDYKIQPIKAISIKTVYIKTTAIKAKQGFSLIEILIVLLILVIGITGTLKMQVYVQKQAGFSLHSIQALNSAEAKLEELSVAQYAISGNDVSDIFERQWQIKSPQLIDVQLKNINLVAVTVKWRNNLNQFESIELQTAVVIPTNQGGNRIIDDTKYQR